MPVISERSRSKTDDDDDASRTVRDRILDAAAQLFYAEGIESVGIDRILGEAEAARASLYQHFGSKAGLVTCYLEAQVDLTRARIEAVLGAVGVSPRDRLLQLFDHAAARARGPGFRGCAFHNAAAEITDPDHPAAGVLVAQHTWMRARVESVLHELAVEHPPLLADALVALHSGAIVAAQLERSAAPCDAARWAAETLLDTAAR